MQWDRGLKSWRIFSLWPNVLISFLGRSCLSLRRWVWNICILKISANSDLKYWVLFGGIDSWLFWVFWRFWLSEDSEEVFPIFGKVRVDFFYCQIKSLYSLLYWNFNQVLFLETLSLFCFFEVFSSKTLSSLRFQEFLNKFWLFLIVRIFLEEIERDYSDTKILSRKKISNFWHFQRI